MWLTIGIIVYVLLAIALIIGLLLKGIRPSRTLGWVLAIFTIPIGGMLLYLLFGRNRRKKKLTKLGIRETRLPKMEISEQFWGASEKRRRLMNLINGLCNFPPTEDNAIEVLKDGESTFSSIFSALESAREYIHLEYYIFKEGKLADRLLDLFTRKRKEGVEIRMIYDGVGSLSLSKSYRKQLQKIGVEVHPFLPLRFSRFFSDLNFRNHRKIIVVDGKVGFTGGMNIADYYMEGKDHLGLWHDLHLCIKGPSVQYLNQVFKSDWFMVAEENLEMQPLPEKDVIGRGITMQVAYGGPDTDFHTIEKLFLTIITSAQKYLYITNPYIIPSSAILQALQTAALCGVDVRLLIARKSDIKLVKWTVRSYFEPLLKAGVRIFLFPEGFLHSKLILSDDEIATIGTSNIDVRSFEHNYEVNAVIYDKEFSQLLRKDFTIDCDKSEELEYAAFVKRPVIDKLREGAARIFAPML